MRWLVAVLLLSVLPSPPDLAKQRESIQSFYASGDAASLDALFHRTTSRELNLLCRYRLYPLTEDAAYVADLPDELDDASARELALLSGLWGYRLHNASAWQTARLGLRSHKLLERAKALDANEPYVLLIEGQSLLFRPAIFGGDAHAALQRFRTLQSELASYQASGISTMEAALWEWFALDRLGAPQADAIRDRLLAEDPPPMYRRFLLAPP